MGLDKDLVQGVGSCVRFCVIRFCDDYDYNPEELVATYLENGDCIILTGSEIK